MKKRTVGLLLALSLSFTMIGCGSSAEPKQEVEKEQEEQSNSEDTETESFVFFSEEGEREYLLEDFEWEENNIEFTTQYETNIYNMEGRNVGYIKANVPITITEHGINSAWYRFLNPEGGTDYEYLCVLMEDVTAQGGEIPVPQDENSGIDTEMLWIYPKDYEYGNDQDVTGLTWEGCNVEFENKGVLQLYADDGKNVAWLHEDITVTFTEENEEWYRFKNPESQIGSEYLLVTKESIDSQNQYIEEQAEYEEQEKTYDEVIALIDENKTYTVEEFHSLMQEAAEIIGIKYDYETAKQGGAGKRTLNLNGKELKKFFEDELVWYLISGPTGNNKMDVYFLIEDGVDTTGDFECIMFAMYHQENNE